MPRTLKEYGHKLSLGLYHITYFSSFLFLILCLFETGRDSSTVSPSVVQQMCCMVTPTDIC